MKHIAILILSLFIGCHVPTYCKEATVIKTVYDSPYNIEGYKGQWVTTFELKNGKRFTFVSCSKFEWKNGSTVIVEMSQGDTPYRVMDVKWIC